jgi:hypothetical protein
MELLQIKCFLPVCTLSILNSTGINGFFLFEAFILHSRFILHCHRYVCPCWLKQNLFVIAARIVSFVNLSVWASSFFMASSAHSCKQCESWPDAQHWHVLGTSDAGSDSTYPREQYNPTATAAEKSCDAGQCQLGGYNSTAKQTIAALQDFDKSYICILTK